MLEAAEVDAAIASAFAAFAQPRAFAHPQAFAQPQALAFAPPQPQHLL